MKVTEHDTGIRDRLKAVGMTTIPGWIAASLCVAVAVWLLLIFLRWLQLRGKKPFRAIAGEASLLFLAAVGLIVVMMAYIVPVNGWIDDFSQRHGLNGTDTRLMYKGARYVFMFLFFGAVIVGPILLRKLKKRMRRSRRNPREDLHSSSRTH